MKALEIFLCDVIRKNPAKCVAKKFVCGDWMPYENVNLFCASREKEMSIKNIVYWKLSKRKRASKLDDV